jgi:hypothetical protein
MELAKSTFIFWKNRCWNCKKENCSIPRCTIPIDRQQIEINKLEWMEQNNKDGTAFKVHRGTRGPKAPSKNWCPPDAHENNKRIIFGKPYTWNGTTSWILDDTPDSGLTETPGLNVADRKASPTGGVPSQVPSDDATAMTTDTGLTQEQQNEILRIQANIQNIGANLASILEQE